MAALDYLRRAGLVVEANGDRLRLRPADRITDAVRQFVRDHRAELLAELNAANDSNHLELPASESPHYILTAATASSEWIAVRDRYIGHLMTCRGCHAPLGRYCATGAYLCAQYAASPWS